MNWGPKIVEQTAGARFHAGGRWWLNFAATNYLGLHAHPAVVAAMADIAAGWGASLGMPRAMAVDRLTVELESTAAELMRQEMSLVFPSTSQAANDLIPQLSRDDGAVFLDEWAYPISVSAAQSAARRGARIVQFAHNNHSHLARLLTNQNAVRHKVVVCDGVYAAGGQIANLGNIAEVASRSGAVLYVDDAHGIGLLGEHPTGDRPYGDGGRGTPSYFGVTSARLVHVAGFSKAFGVPLAIVSGSKSLLRPIHDRSMAYVHSSPASPVLVAAALAALRVHRVQGDAIRRRLCKLVRTMRHCLRGLPTTATSLLPIQSISCRTTREAVFLFRALRQHGVWSVPQAHPRDHPQGGVLRLVITAQHELSEIVSVAELLNRILHRGPSTRCHCLSFASPRVVVG